MALESNHTYGAVIAPRLLSLLAVVPLEGLASTPNLPLIGSAPVRAIFSGEALRWTPLYLWEVQLRGPLGSL